MHSLFWILIEYPWLQVISFFFTTVSPRPRKTASAKDNGEDSFSVIARNPFKLVRTSGQVLIDDPRDEVRGKLTHIRKKKEELRTNTTKVTDYILVRMEISKYAMLSTVVTEEAALQRIDLDVIQEERNALSPETYSRLASVVGRPAPPEKKYSANATPAPVFGGRRDLGNKRWYLSNTDFAL